MRIYAYCGREFEVATRRVVGDGAMVMTSPPVYAHSFQAKWLAGRDFVYLDLHGRPSSWYLWTGPRQSLAALGLESVKEAKLDGAIVFATTCYLPQTHFIQAFLGAGASAVIAGEGENFGTSRRVTGAQLLARFTLRSLRRGLGVEAALEEAKRQMSRDLVARLLDGGATADALQFKIWRG